MRAESKQKSCIDVAKRMLKAGKLNDEDIADYSGLSIPDVEALKESM